MEFKMKNILIFLFYICTLTISGCSTNSPSPRQIPVIWTKDAATSIEIENAKTLVLNQLKDPESARFGEFWALKGSNGHRSICGYVNAKNSFGGYSGRSMFTLNNTSVIMEGHGVLGSLLPNICMPRTVK